MMKAPSARARSTASSVAKKKRPAAMPRAHPGRSRRKARRSTCRRSCPMIAAEETMPTRLQAGARIFTGMTSARSGRPTAPPKPRLPRSAKGAHALNPRGEFYSPENIQERLALRNYLDELRGTGERTGGPAALDNTDRKRFADQLDRFLAKLRQE